MQGSSEVTVSNTYAKETSNEKQLLVLRTLKLTMYLFLDPTPWPNPPEMKGLHHMLGYDGPDR